MFLVFSATYILVVFNKLCVGYCILIYQHMPVHSVGGFNLQERECTIGKKS